MPTELTVSELADIICTCSDKKVKKIDFKGVQIEFFGSQEHETRSWTPPTQWAPEGESEEEEEKSAEDIQDELDRLLLEDPEEYERREHALRTNGIDA